MRRVAGVPAFPASSEILYTTVISSPLATNRLPVKSDPSDISVLAGSVMVNVTDFRQPLASLAVTVYVPAASDQ